MSRRVCVHWQDIPIRWFVQSQSKNHRHRHGKERKRANEGRKCEHSSRQMKQRDCLAISFFHCHSVLFARYAVFIASLSSYDVSYFWGIWCACICVSARFFCRFEMYFSKMNDIYRNRNAPKVLHACAHSETFSFSQVLLFFFFFGGCRCVSVVFCSSPFHWPRFNFNAQIVCMHMRMRKRTTKTVFVHTWSTRATKPKLSQHKPNDRKWSSKSNEKENCKWSNHFRYTYAKVQCRTVRSSTTSLFGYHIKLEQQRQRESEEKTSHLNIILVAARCRCCCQLIIC